MGENKTKKWDVGSSHYGTQVSKFFSYQCDSDVPIEQTKNAYIWGNIESWIINELGIRPSEFARIKISVELIDRIKRLPPGKSENRFKRAREYFQSPHGEKENE